MTDELEAQIVDLYKSGSSAGKILEEIGTFKTTKTVYDVLKKHDVAARSQDICRDPNLDHWYFHKIDSPDKAYALGLMLTDGWVTKPPTDQSGNRLRAAQIGFALTESDQYLVYWMRDQWGSSNKISHIHKCDQIFPDGKTHNVSPAKRIMVTSTRMFMDLDSLGIDTRKSYISILPIIDVDLYPFLLRGIIDGDGSIVDSGNGYLSITFLGTQALMGQISWFLHHHLGLTYVKPTGKNNVVLSSLIYTVTEETQRLGEYIYGDLNATAYMKRKYEKYENFFLK